MELSLMIALYSISRKAKSIQQTNTNLYIGGGISGFLAGLIGTGGAIRGLVLSAFNLEKEVVFLDVSNNFSFKTRSTMNTRETIKWEDGKEYPLAKIETSSESHPFYTGTQKIMDTAGRVEKFRQKFGAKAGAKASVKE